MTAPAESPSWSRGTSPETPTFTATPADMPPVQPAAAAPTDQGAEDQPDTPDAPSEESKAMAKLRKENADWRTKLRAQEEAAKSLREAQEKQAAETASLKDVLAKLQSVLNPDSDTPPDPAKLAEQLTAAQAETARVAAEKDQAIRDLTIRAALPGIAAKANANLDGVQDFLVASGALAKLDPVAATFTADLESAVAAALDARPYLKNAQVAKRSGAEIPGRNGGSDQLTREQLKGMTPEQINKAREAGQLNKLLSGG